MEEQPNPEGIKSPDFLNEQLRMSLDISDRAFEHLPEVNPIDLETKKEQYRVLLGTWERTPEGDIKLKVESVMEVPDQPHYYVEGKESVDNINIPALRQTVQYVSENDEASKGLELVGDIHTHPITQEELEPNQRPWMLSPEDIEAMVESYENGSLSADRPFIFGIAAPMPDGKTGYKFYRLIKSSEGYATQEVK